MKKRLNLTLALLAVGTTMIFAQTKEETKKVKSFDQINVSSGIDVYLAPGTSEEVKIRASEDIMEYVVAEVQGNTLVIKIDNKGRRWNWTNHQETTVYVTYTTLRQIEASGGSDVFTSAPLRAESFTIHASGGSDLKMDLNVQNLVCHTSGGADLDLSGSAETIKLECSGGSDTQARDLRTQNAVVEASGGADIYLTVNGELDVEASGASDVTIYGKPRVTHQSSSGAADITIQ
ncbi:MAG: DUF2807 domain-containing protein [Saprospiraceae bacterium]|nr:DUF2807 domain-containing protein [Saprospiraceae bacterium]